MFLLVKLMQGTADSFTLVFYRSVVQIIISLSQIVKNKENPFGAAKSRGWLLVRGGFGAGAVIAWFFGIQNLPLPDAVTLQFTTPVFAAVFGFCLVGEDWKRLDMIGAFVCLLGVALIAHPTWLFGVTIKDDDEATTSTLSPEDADSEAAMKGLAVGVTTAGAAMAGLAYVSVRLIGVGTSANVMVLYYAVLSIPIVLFGSHWLLHKWSVWGDGSFTVWDYFLLLLTGFAGYGGQFFTNLGLQRETAATGTLATSTQIVWTYIFELAFLHESINGWSLAGTGLILGFMIIVGISKMIEEKPEPTTQSSPEEQGLLLAPSDEKGDSYLVAEC
jgi:drug/metabolite transporter (DMT)-like permease